MQRNNILIALVCLLIGFVSAYYFLAQDETVKSYKDNRDTADEHVVLNPFQAASSSTDDDRLNYLAEEIAEIKQQLQSLEQAVNKSASLSIPQQRISLPGMNSTAFASSLNRRFFNVKSLIRGGIDSALAEDLVRRKNSHEIKRLELHDRAKREGYLNTQQYFDELEEINNNDVSLRDELGEDSYDHYLFDSKQNNRIKIVSVMLGSNAEQIGIQSGDIVLSYDNARMFRWQELKEATTEGELGEYVYISISRNGEIFSFSVPRGPLGLQLGAARLQP